MAHSPQYHEDKTRRQTWPEPDGMAYRRTYDLPFDLVEAGDMPKEGDPMPGTTATLLGPFIERGGVSVVPGTGGAQLKVTLKCKLLTAKTVPNAWTYTELVGRQIGSVGLDTVYRTRGIAGTATDTTAPHKGHVLTGTPLLSHTIAPVCQQRPVIDEQTYPQRFLFLATFVAPMTRAEFDAP